MCVRVGVCVYGFIYISRMSRCIHMYLYESRCEACTFIRVCVDRDVWLRIIHDVYAWRVFCIYVDARTCVCVCVCEFMRACVCTLRASWPTQSTANSLYTGSVCSRSAILLFSDLSLILFSSYPSIHPIHPSLLPSFFPFRFPSLLQLTLRDRSGLGVGLRDWDRSFTLLVARSFPPPPVSCSTRIRVLCPRSFLPWCLTFARSLWLTVLRYMCYSVDFGFFNDDVGFVLFLLFLFLFFWCVLRICGFLIMFYHVCSSSLFFICMFHFIT